MYCSEALAFALDDSNRCFIHKATIGESPLAPSGIRLSSLKLFGESRPFGVNNRVFPNVAMPDPFLKLQGTPVLACHQVPKIAANGGEMRDPLVSGKAITEEQCGFIDVVEGTGQLTPKEFDQAVYDIANFLYYVAEPARFERERLGIYVLLFLVVLYVFTALLGREYNKEVH